MEILRGQKITLRLLDPKDVDDIFRIENNQEFWEISDTRSPFSLQTIKEYVANAHRDITEVKQLRLAICNLATGRLLGLLDLFDFDAHHRRAGVGILIEDPQDRNKGYASESLRLLRAYAKEDLRLHQLYANIFEDNVSSITLFEKQGFKKIGVKEDWRQVGEVYKNEILYQHIL